MQKVLTEADLRSHWFRTRGKTYVMDEGTYVTPAAWEFLKEHGMSIQTVSPSSSQSMPVSPIPTAGGKARYVDAATGAAMDEKPEHMTHLHGNVLVPKTHPQIAFRGQLDSLMAQVMEVQLVAVETGRQAVADTLDEVLHFLRMVLSAEVKEETLPPMQLLGMDSAQLRAVSHDVQKYIGIPHPVPDYRMGRLCVALNRLRTQVREVELYAAHAFFVGEKNTRPDIIEGLNRLSSCVYIIFCRTKAGYYDEVKANEPVPR